MKIQSFNPSNNQMLGEVDATTEKELAEFIEKAKVEQVAWATLSVDARLKHMQNMKDIFENNKERIAELVSKEMGMPIRESLPGDVESGLNYLQWYIDNAKKHLEPEITYESEIEVHKVFYEPKGLVASIIPWNYPFSSFVWQGCQNLIVGNAVIMKHSEQTPLCGQLIAKLIEQSTLPKNVFTMIYGDDVIGDKLAKSDVQHICLTGSSATGKLIYKTAADKFISATMELGGSAPGIVFADADIDNIAEAIYIARFSNCGQTCDGLKRLIVHELVYDKTINKLKEFLENKKVGDAFDKTADIGALVSKKQLERLEEQVLKAINKGAKLITGGKRIDLNGGNFYAPTLLSVTAENPIMHEETFGPVLVVTKFKNIDEAIAVANNTKYGLGSYVFTESAEIFNKVARELKTGMVAWNELYYLLPQNPFGGIKESGFGRNHGKWGFQELCNIKIVTLRKNINR